VNRQSLRTAAACVVALAASTACVVVIARTGDASCSPQPGWDYRAGAWYDQRGDLVGYAPSEDTPMACETERVEP
jgi:hypothetical protein